MFLKMKNRVELELKNYIRGVNKRHRLCGISPALSKHINEFILRKGKRIRPILYCIGYLGFAQKPAPGIFRSALSLELLHDFMLVHDDIIDKSQTRRGRPSMHALLNQKFAKNKNLKFSGTDLAIITGDVMYALALDVFLTVKEDPAAKALALKKLISAVIYTGNGEFIELLLGAKSIEKVTQNDIYQVYDYKTANYTFASPLAMGAALAGAKPQTIGKLYRYGMYLGRAFQIKDDIIGTFGKEKETGKSNLTDLKEAKRTLLIWYAFNHAPQKDQALIKKIMSSHTAGLRELKQARRIIQESGALAYAKKQIMDLSRKALREIDSIGMRKAYKETLINFSQKVLKT